MRYILCSSKYYKDIKILEQYPVLKKYKPQIDYPYPNPKAARLSIEVDDIIKFRDDIGKDIIVSKDVCECDDIKYSLEIYDGYRE